LAVEDIDGSVCAIFYCSQRSDYANFSKPALDVDLMGGGFELEAAIGIEPMNKNFRRHATEYHAVITRP